MNSFFPWFGLAEPKTIAYADKPLSNKVEIQQLPRAEFDKLVSQRGVDFRYSDDMQVPQDLADTIADDADIDKAPVAKISELLKTPYRDWVICRLNNEMGFGVFTQTPIAKDSLIGLYTGELQKGLNPEDDYRADARSTWGEEIHISAMHVGNFTRFINHADDRASKLLGGQQNNLVYEFDMHEGMPLISFRALRDIRAGEQLLVDYGDLYWQQRELHIFQHKGKSRSVHEQMRRRVALRSALLTGGLVVIVLLLGFI